MFLFNALGILLLCFVLVVIYSRGYMVLSAAFAIAVMWLVSICLYAALIRFDNPAILLAALLITVLCVSYIGGSLPRKRISVVNNSAPRRTIEKSIAFFPVLFGTAAVAGLVGLYILLEKSGGFSALWVSASYYSHLRYEEGVGIPIQVRALNVVLYTGMAVALLVFWERLVLYNRKSFLLLLPALMLLLESMLIGTKSIAVLCFVYATSAYLIVVNYYQKGVKRKSVFFGIILAVLALFVFAIFVQWIRTGGTLAIIDVIEKILTSYLWLPFVAFLKWAGGWNVQIIPQNLGTHVFAGISAYLFDDYEKTGDFVFFHIHGEIYHTNVYTALRPIVSDFGLIGAVIFVAGLGWSLGYSTRRVRSGALFFVPILFVLSNFVLFSFAASMFKYTTNILVSISIVLYFLFTKGARGVSRIA